MTRLYGKPFSVSEFNYAAPNPYRAESGLLMGAVSALQDWDAIWRFAYAHSKESEANPSPLDYFNMATDPVQSAAERAALLLFVRRDAAPSASRVTAIVRRSDLMDRPKANAIPDLRGLTNVTRVGVRILKDGAPAPSSGKSEVQVQASGARRPLQELRDRKLLPAKNRTNPGDGITESATGEIVVDANHGSMTVHTPRTVGGIARAGDRISAGPLQVAVEGARAAVWVSSLDGKPVAESRRLLVIHATDAQNTGMRYSAPSMRVLEDWGGLPHLLRAGKAGLTLRNAQGKRLKVWRLDTSGHRVAPIPIQTDGSGLHVELSTRAPNGKATLFYEIAAE
jgi:hypothetical protein